MAVTRRQKEILDFLESFVTRNGYSPSFEEIARGMGLKSLATVHKHITNLEKKGMLDRVHNRSRSIDVLPPGTRTRSSDRLPLAGRIAAGLPCTMWSATAMSSPSRFAETRCAMSTSSVAIMCS
jgi:repressor LexA